ncbi:uncharacterized protein DAT39_018748 [Clarias magur]|uniref:Uncharacterized protein n=1 Tax=Clarias magur TaxID=1594786 RepID=A0A8J4T8H4_CLAMG|nr:uncharacterized protein DAT39_018748 [Clarias magur]
MFTASRGDIRDSSQPTVRERRIPHPDSPSLIDNAERSRNIMGGAFAAELEVIQQRARTSGPSRATHPIETGARQRNTERHPHPLPPSSAVEQRSGIPPYQGQPTSMDGPRTKLALFDGSGDWESILVPFERQARKHGWSGHYRVDCLYDCLRGGGY